MKTTLEIPNEIYRQAKIKAATDGRKLKDLVSEALSLLLNNPSTRRGNSETDLSGDTSSTARKPGVPDWYGSLASYIKPGKGTSDMNNIRTSIARGIVAERQV